MSYYIAKTVDGAFEGVVARVIENLKTQGFGVLTDIAVVDVPTPLDKAQINDYTRYLARKLMDDMTQTWAAAPMRDHRPATAPSGARFPN